MGQGLPNLDLREALFNDRAIGPIGKVQVPAERITTLHGIMLDLDPKILRPGNKIFTPADTPEEFYRSIKPILARHLILWLSPAVELRTAAEQLRWGTIVKSVQRTLPIDTDMPGITAVTRSVGSVNSKNDAVVTTLHAGEPVSPEMIEQFMMRLAKGAFREVVLPLLEELRISPCPICRGENTRLDLLDWVGICYGSCGKITLEHLFEAIYMPRPSSPMEPGALAPTVPQNTLVDTIVVPKSICSVDDLGRVGEVAVAQQGQN